MSARWVRYVTSDGRPYWHDTVTNQTSWAPPPAVPPAPAAAGPPMAPYAAYGVPPRPGPAYGFAAGPAGYPGRPGMPVAASAAPQLASAGPAGTSAATAASASPTTAAGGAGGVQAYYQQMQAQRSVNAAGNIADAIQRAKELAAQRQAQAQQQQQAQQQAPARSWAQSVGAKLPGAAANNTVFGPASNAGASASASAATPGAASGSAAAVAVKDYPPALVAYVTRVFASPQAARFPTQVRAQLQARIQAVAAEKPLGAHNWAAEPLITPHPAPEPAWGARPGQTGAAGGRGNNFGGADDDDSDDDDDDGPEPNWDQHPALARLTGKRRRKMLLQLQKQYRQAREQRRRQGGAPGKGMGAGGMPQRKKIKLAAAAEDESPEERRRRQERLARFGGAGAETSGLSKKQQKQQQGNKKKQQQQQNKWGWDDSEDEEEEFDLSKLKIVGTCQTLEKSFFRLGALPLPEEVRPQPVLERALEHILRRWQANRDYAYACDQLKSLRQDLTVQHIANAFAVRAYEAHARICLEVGDFSEFNQCQTQLWHFYHAHLGQNGITANSESSPKSGKSVKLANSSGDPSQREFETEIAERLRCLDEFTAYRLLYFELISGDRLAFLATLQQIKATCPGFRVADVGRAGSGSSSGSGSGDEEEREDTTSVRPATAHALEVCRALRYNQFWKLFRLIEAAPHHGRFMLQHSVVPARFRALETICRAYRPARVPLPFVAEQLGFLRRPSSSSTSTSSSSSSSSGSASVSSLSSSVLSSSSANAKSSSKSQVSRPLKDNNDNNTKNNKDNQDSDADSDSDDSDSDSEEPRDDDFPQFFGLSADSDDDDNPDDNGSFASSSSSPGASSSANANSSDPQNPEVRIQAALARFRSTPGFAELPAKQQRKQLKELRTQLRQKYAALQQQHDLAVAQKQQQQQQQQQQHQNALGQVGQKRKALGNGFNSNSNNSNNNSMAGKPRIRPTLNRAQARGSTRHPGLAQRLCRRWIRACGGEVSADGQFLETKMGSETTTGSAQSLEMPTVVVSGGGDGGSDSGDGNNSNSGGGGMAFGGEGRFGGPSGAASTAGDGFLPGAVTHSLI